MLLFDGIVVIALATAFLIGIAVTFVVVAFARAAPLLAARAGRSVDIVMIGGPRWPQRSARRKSAARLRLPVVGGALHPA